jgi:hypothetical protein
MTHFESLRPDWLSVGEALRRILSGGTPGGGGNLRRGRTGTPGLGSRGCLDHDGGPGSSRNEVFPAGPQGSGLARSKALCHGLAVIPEDLDRIPEGELVKVLLLDDFGAGSPSAEYLP